MAAIGGAVFGVGGDADIVGQLEPLGVFLASVVADRLAPARASAGGADAAASAAAVWDVFRVAVAACFALSFASLRGQIVALAGARGLYPCADMLRAAARDLPRGERWLRIPVLWLWRSCADGDLVPEPAGHGDARRRLRRRRGRGRAARAHGRAAPRGPRRDGLLGPPVRGRRAGREAPARGARRASRRARGLRPRRPGGRLGRNAGGECGGLGLRRAPRRR